MKKKKKKKKKLAKPSDLEKPEKTCSWETLKATKKGKTKKEAIAEIGIKEKYVNYWLKRNLEIFDKFKNNNVKVTVDLILEGFEKDKSKKEISKFLQFIELYLE